MEPIAVTLGVPVASSPPPEAPTVAAAQRQSAAVLPSREVPPVVMPRADVPPVWPRSAQVVTALLLVLSIALTSWHAYSLSGSATRPTEPGFTLDLNRADRAELRQLPGIGEALAGRIDEFRRQHGPFQRVEDLRKVRGIGPAILERLRPFITVDRTTRDEDETPVAPSPERRPRPPTGEDIVPVALHRKPVLGRVDLNRATGEELRKLPGIGVKMSERILESRRSRPFASVDDLRRVPGVGPKTLERLRPLVSVENAADSAALAP